MIILKNNNNINNNILKREKKKKLIQISLDLLVRDVKHLKKNLKKDDELNI